MQKFIFEAKAIDVLSKKVGKDGKIYVGQAYVGRKVAVVVEMV